MKGKVLKKLTAYAMVAAMAVSTPLTASAAEFADNFWISDGGSESGTETGTVSTTDTNTTVLNENAASILGLAISPASVVMGQYETQTLEATVLTDGKIDDATMKQIISQIKWRSSNNSIVTVDAKKESMNICPINAKKGGFATVTAGLDLDNDGTDDYVARTRVMVKVAATGLEWNISADDHFYVKHTYDLHDFVTVTPADATDDIAFGVKGSAKVATVSEDGILTVKAVSKNAAENKLTLVAKISDKIIAEKEVTVEAGSPVSKLTASNKGKVEVDFNQNGKAVDAPEANISVTAATKDGKATTDDIVWTSNNEKIATVDVSEDDTKAVVTGVAVGKAKITATATSGKKATFTVTVKATLISIDEVVVDDSWSGKTEVVTVKRTPAQNTDKLKITTDNKLVKAKNYTVTSAADLKAESIQVKVTATDSKTKKSATSAAVTIKQSDVKLTNVMYRTDKTQLMNKKTVKANAGRQLVYNPVIDAAHATPGAEAVSWVSGKEAVATVADGKVKVVGDGTAKITASSVYKDGNKYKTAKVTFTVKSAPKCEEIVLKSNTAAAAVGQKVTIQVKAQLPKKAADTITWYVNGNKVAASKDATDKKLTYIVNANDAVDGKISVVARTATTATEATIYVASPAKKVTATAAKTTLTVGETTTITAKVEGKDTTLAAEPVVSYTVNKAGVVKVDANGNVTAIGQGKVTVNAVTASGKKGAVKIEVK